MKRAVSLEKFYTKPEIAELCLKELQLGSYDRIIEPSAGNGSFSGFIPGCEAYDIEPENDKIRRQDFLELDVEKGNILVVGNPPFGRQSSLAVRFINHAAKFARTIAFILPKSFSKESMMNRLDKHLLLLKTAELPENCFYYEDREFDIPCRFYVFEYSEKPREKQKKYRTDDFVFCKKTEADFSIRRVGFYAGRIEGVDVSESSHYFVKDKTGKAAGILKRTSYTDRTNTVGARSVSKNEIIKEYLCQKDKDMALISRASI